MPNLKPYYDAALAERADVKRIMAEMDAAFNEGTEDGKKKALELRPALDDAKLKAEEASKLYNSMRDASLVNDSAASLFTTPPDPAKDDQKDSQKSQGHEAARFPGAYSQRPPCFLKSWWKSRRLGDCNG